MVFSELMINPNSGGEYVEVLNTGTQSIDLSWWELTAGDESYRLPHGTMLAPTSRLVIADAHRALTNAYVELSNPATMIERYTDYELWDYPIVFTGATEYASRVVKIDPLTLPNNGATLALYDICSNLIDSVTYTNGGAWPTNLSLALELVDPTADNALAASWRSAAIVGTPGTANSATRDMDGDALPDAWEQQIIDTPGSGFTMVSQVLPTADFDGDGVTNEREFVLGTDPTVPDALLGRLAPNDSGGYVGIQQSVFTPTGDAYRDYIERYYTLQCRDALLSGAWTNIPAATLHPSANGMLVWSNAPPIGKAFYRTEVELQPLRP